MSAAVDLNVSELADLIIALDAHASDLRTMRRDARRVDAPHEAIDAELTRVETLSAKLEARLDLEAGDADFPAIRRIAEARGEEPDPPRYEVKSDVPGY